MLYIVCECFSFFYLQGIGSLASWQMCSFLSQLISVTLEAYAELICRK